MTTVTFDGLWPTVQPSKSVNNLMQRLIENQERRAQYRVAMMYDARTLRRMGMDEETIKRVIGPSH